MFLLDFFGPWPASQLSSEHDGQNMCDENLQQPMHF